MHGIHLSVFFISNCMIRIKYKSIDGFLNTETGAVMFYHFKYKNILEAIKKVELDIKSDEQEIKIFNEILGHLFITSD